MKKLIVFIFAITLSTNSILANNSKLPKDVKKEIRTEITKLLNETNNNISVEMTQNKEVKVEVEFMITKNGKVVVLHVDSKNTLLEEYIKRTLNYKKITTQKFVKNESYKMPVVFKVKQS